MALTMIKCTAVVFCVVLFAQHISCISIFASSKPGSKDPELVPSVQLILRNIGFGILTDPLFNHFRRRWDTIRSNPIMKSILPQSAQSANAQAVANAAANIAYRMLKNRI